MSNDFEPARLRPMSESEFTDYLERAIPSYAENKSKEERISMADAMTLSKTSFDGLLPQGVQTPFQFLFVIETSSKVVGMIWFGRKMNYDVTYAWIYDIEVYDDARGQGYGKQAMDLIELEVKKVGLNSIGLHVFGRNTIARNLYEKQGYETTNVIMRKDI